MLEMKDTVIKDNTLNEDFCEKKNISNGLNGLWWQPVDSWI